MSLMQVDLDDKYRLEAGRIYLSGIQALVRLPLLQRQRDRIHNLSTAGFISGYRGSPLGMYDSALWRAKSHLQANDIAFVPGLNEDLAATAVWGSQQVGLFPGAKVDGVFGIWYGKGPGVDRSTDALKHANSAGTSRYGGVLALAGDDHGCQSSTLAHQSEHIFAAAMMPILNPATLQEYLDLGLLGFALSRFSGCWVGFKAISETVESSASIYSDPSRIDIITPDDFTAPPGGLWIRWPDAPLEQERRLHGPKMQAVAAFARANKLDRIMLDSPAARLGIVATGKAYLDLRQALADLGITDQAGQELGFRIYKVALTWPLEEAGARRFAEGLQDVLVIEEKRGFIEDQLVRLLYNMDAPKRPTVVGKRDERGAVLLPSEGELTPTMVASAVMSRLRRLGYQAPASEQRLARLELHEKPAVASSIKLHRTPYFCSGCPHNSSTKIPDGSRAMAGIGCHGMALYVPNRRTATISHMGGEGAKRIAIVSDEPKKYPRRGYFPDGTTIHHRRELDRVQRELREINGLTVLIYDQTCAAEKRRRRKRGLFPDPPKRVFINDLVCEGCGDCSATSNCVSVQPLETEFGRKRQIDQSSCNKDFSCVEGFCPSFVTVHGGRPKRAERSVIVAHGLYDGLPIPPQRRLDEPYNILIAGIGGTGVITIGALLGMAAHLEGRGCAALDFTGLAQKNGAVMSHVRIAANPEDISAVRIAAGGADLILGCDIVVSASPAALSRTDYSSTRAVINAELQPTASFVINPDIDFEAGAMQRAIRDAVGDQHLDVTDATSIATTLLGDSIATNAFMLGYAFQKGLIPLSLEAILKAIELNGAAVEMNTQAFSWGRLAAEDMSRVRESTTFRIRPENPVKTLDETIAGFAAFLTVYQNKGYADRYLRLVATVRAAERGASPTSTELTEAVAKNLFKLMAYKDEYEVARLYVDGTFAKKLGDRFEGDFRLSFHLAPPLFARRDPMTGHLQKEEYGEWVMRAFRMLARLKFLRGTIFDPFGYSNERKSERKLIADYEAMIMRHTATLNSDQIGAVARLARLPEMVRGYGHIKEENIRRFLVERAQVEADVENGVFAIAAE